MRYGWRPMSGPYEQTLPEYLTGLDRSMGESQALVERSTDPETLHNLNDELMKQGALRDEYAVRLRRVTSLNRLARRSIIAFGLSFAALFVFVFTGVGDVKIAFVFAATDLLILFGSAAIYVGVITVRDVIVRGYRPWRFSLRTVLVAMAVISVLPGMLVYAVRN
jgi:hypothetical protein